MYKVTIQDPNCFDSHASVFIIGELGLTQELVLLYSQITHVSDCLTVASTQAPLNCDSTDGRILLNHTLLVFIKRKGC